MVSICTAYGSYEPAVGRHITHFTVARSRGKCSLFLYFERPEELDMVFLKILYLVESLVLLVFALAGCAMSPQTVALNPLIDVPSHPVGGGRELALEVVDQRSRPDFGNRGGVYDTALISPRTDVARTLRQALVERFRASGFKVVPAGRDTPLSVRVEIKRIDYMASLAPLVGEVRVDAAIEAIVHNNDRTLTGKYEASSDHRVMSAPGESENERMLNEVVSQTLAQLLKDNTVWNLLAE